MKRLFAAVVACCLLPLAPAATIVQTQTHSGTSTQYGTILAAVSPVLRFDGFSPTLGTLNGATFEMNVVADVSITQVMGTGQFDGYRQADLWFRIHERTETPFASTPHPPGLWNVWPEVTYSTAPVLLAHMESYTFSATHTANHTVSLASPTDLAALTTPDDIVLRVTTGGGPGVSTPTSWGSSTVSATLTNTLTYDYTPAAVPDGGHTAALLTIGLFVLGAHRQMRPARRCRSV